MSDRPYLVFGSPLLEQEEKDAVRATLDSAWIGTGPKVHEFERAIAAYVGAEHAVAVNSCTAALHLSMVVSGVGPGDEVITTPMTFAATANAIVHTGATPVFVDCKLDSMNIDTPTVESAVTARTRALLPVHFAGRPVDMAALGALAKRLDLVLIEDAAHALEAAEGDRKVGSFADLTCFSFYVTKNITTGEGGMITTNRADLAEKLKIYALHGLSADAWSRFSDKGYSHYQVVFPGFKYNLTDVAASLGLVQLRKVDLWLHAREKAWAAYDEAFADLPVRRPKTPEPQTRHARHLYTLLIDHEHSPVTRDEFIVAMHERGIGTGVHYRGVHLHPYYRDRFGLTPEQFPNATYISERTVSLPLSPKLTDSDLDRVITAVRAILTARQ